MSLISVPSTFDVLACDIKPSGPLGAEFLIINDCPDLMELKENAPLAGNASGQFDRVLSAVGIPRFRCRITSAIKTRPPKGNMNELFNAKGWEHPQLSIAAQELRREIRECAANVIIGLGELPLLMLTGERGVENYRGSVFEIEGKYFIPTIHPSKAAPNVNPVNFWIIYLDLCKAKRINDNGFSPFKHELLIAPTFQEVMDFLSTIEDGHTTAVDLETPNKSIACFGLTSNDARKAMCIPFTDANGHYFTEDEEVIIWHRLAQILENPSIKKVFQNGMFDVSVLLRYMGIRTRNIYFDTMIAQHLCWTDLPKNLGFIVSLYTLHQYHKDEGRHKRGEIENWREYWLYNAKDAQRTHEVVEPLWGELRELGAVPTFEFLMRLHEPLLEMQYNGLPVKRKEMLAYKDVLEEKIAKAQAKLNAIAGGPLNANSPKQLQDFFYIKMGHKPYLKKGKITTDEIAMKRLDRKGVPGAAEVREIRKLRKLSGTYFVEANLDEDDRLRCEYSISGTETGRLASSSTIFFGTGTNLQNQTWEFKQFVCPPLGKIFIEVDLSQAEARDVAYLSEDANMMKGFESGVDVHRFNASNIFGVPMNEVTDEQRSLGKKVVHASNYAMGPKTFSLQAEISEREASKLLEVYHQRYPGLRLWHKSIRDELAKSRILYNLYGRPKRFLGMFNDELFRSAYAYKPQSSIGEALNRVILDVYDDPECDFIALLAQVHDSLLTMVDDNLETVLKTCALLEKHATVTHHANGRTFTIPCDFKIGYRWGDGYGEQGVEVKKPSVEAITAAYHKLQEFKQSQVS